MPERKKLAAGLTAALFAALMWSVPLSLAGDVSVPAGGGKIIDGVPFVKQKDKFCGPAALASVLGFYGGSVTQDEIAREVFIPQLGGALIADLENFARSLGYETETVNGSIDALVSAIDRGTPVIVLVDRGKWKVSYPHYYVVYGYDPGKKELVLHTGDEGGERMPYEKLDEEWKKMNRLMLVVTK